MWQATLPVRSEDSVSNREKQVILFLDIDGVMHPAGARPDQLFCNRENLERVLRAYPAVQVVISSAWRTTVPLRLIRSRFAKDLRRRFFGVTGSMSKFPDPTGQRQDECRAWLDSHCPDAPWIAVDDWVQGFEAGCPHLFLVNPITGLDLSTAKGLGERIADLLRTSVHDL